VEITRIGPTKTKTLFFTSSTSSNMPLTDGNSMAYTGLYKCIFDNNINSINNINNNTEDEQRQQQLQQQLQQQQQQQQQQKQLCGETKKVADGNDRDGPRAALALYNLEFVSNINDESNSGKTTGTTNRVANSNHKSNDPSRSSNSSIFSTSTTTSTTNRIASNSAAFAAAAPPTTSSTSSYLYAHTHIDNKRTHSNFNVNSWEILRAKLPTTRSHQQGGSAGSSTSSTDQVLTFESVFRTLEVFDWNECDFRCCSHNNNDGNGTDDDPFVYSNSNNEHNNGAFNAYAHTHAYVRTIPRSFAVDETTGDIFISWEGFYQHCGGVADQQQQQDQHQERLQWTIGISRLRTEDPYCTTDQVHAMEHNFPRCTEPVSIVFSGSRGREVVLPHGGFAVVPANVNTSNAVHVSNNKSHRTFLLSTLRNPGMARGRTATEATTSQVWAFPEGNGWLEEDEFESEQQQHLLFPSSSGSVVVDSIFLETNVRDGGTLRLHTNPKTGQPDHLCLTIFNKGIGCTPVSMSKEDGIVQPQWQDEYMVLTEDQVASFCKIQHQDGAGNVSNGEFARATTLVTGLDVIWSNDDDDAGGSRPETIVFGCYGGKTGNGNFGCIRVNNDYNDSIRHHPIQVMKGAFPGGVLFVPDELQQALSPAAVKPGIIESSLSSSSSAASSLVVVVLLLVLSSILSFVVFYTKRLQQQRRRSPSSPPPVFFYSQSSPKTAATIGTTACHSHYIELMPTIDDGDDSPSSLRKHLLTTTKLVKMFNFDNA